MPTRSHLPSPNSFTSFFSALFNHRNRAFKTALVLSVVLHAMLFLPAGLFRTHRPPTFNENLVEIKLLQNQKKARPKPAKQVSPASKPIVKHKRKLKTKKKPIPKNKQREVVKKSSLARRRTLVKKKKPAASDKLAEIKKRLARQREENQLDNIRQRLRETTSPEAQARQASLTQVYNQTLTAWIMRNWHLPEHLLNSGLEATISLTIAASGKLLAQNEESLSGNLIFDRAMRQAIANANPFPPFPTELTIPQEEFVITFNPNNIKKEN
jgi:outer membrane biosynthesis protein TonB